MLYERRLHNRFSAGSIVSTKIGFMMGPKTDDRISQTLTKLKKSVIRFYTVYFVLVSGILDSFVGFITPTRSKTHLLSEIKVYWVTVVNP